MKSLSITLLTGTIISSGCSAIHTRTPEGQAVTMSEAEFSSYVERVFRHHNKVYNQLINTAGLDDELSGKGPPTTLISAEEDMVHVCLPLNEVVSTTAEGGRPSMDSKWKLLSAVPACEVATRRVEALIPEGMSHE